MDKPLSERSLEELWELFPILLEPHRAEWVNWFREEADSLRRCLPREDVLGIYHIGSTAIPVILAKPTVDILVETTSACDWGRIRARLETSGYTCMAEERSRLSWNKGYTETGFAARVFHLHLRRPGDNDELYFRDYLCAHPEAAREYESLKRTLCKQYEHNRDAYTDGKHAFVRAYTQLAKAEYAGRYPSKTGAG